MVDLIDGVATAAKLQETLRHKIEQCGEKKPGLAFILVGEHLPSHTYVRMKSRACKQVGIQSIVLQLPADVPQDKLVIEIEKLNTRPDIDGILIQMPLPPHIDTFRVTRAVAPEKDVDGFHPINLGKLVQGEEDGFFPCTPEGILVLLESYSIPTKGRHAVILGRSQLVGSPLSILLAQKKRWGNATVTLAHSQSQHLPELTRSADILVAAIGSAHFVKQNMVKEGAVVIDVGINSLKDLSQPKGYRLVGDVAFEEVAPKCSAITPVPGGVGPMTIALLLQHTWMSFSRRL